MVTCYSRFSESDFGVNTPGGVIVYLGAVGFSSKTRTREPTPTGMLI
jgi:hypothetical protein